ncbi:MAG: penicillin-binding protein [Anaerolineae bacterium]|nr:penicillin-binding protein [Anaerolineae bacterium]
MVNTAQTVKSRHQRRVKNQQSLGVKLGVIGALIFSLLIVSVIVASAMIVTNLKRDLPSVNVVSSLLKPPNGRLLQPTRIFDRSHQQVIAKLEAPAAAVKQYIFVGPNGQPGVDQVPAYLVNGLILEFQPGFQYSPGFSLTGILEGTHATLAQLLAYNLLLEDEEPSVRRNLRERILAAQLTADYGRNQVLEWYLNTVQFSEQVYGADAAARVYFGKPAAQLTLAEAAMLIAMAERPFLDPSAGAQFLKQQQELIIQKMLVKGWITGIEAQQALVEKLYISQPGEVQSISPAFSSLILAQLGEVMPLERLYRGGYEITSSLDADLQVQVECASRIQIERLVGKSDVISAPDGSPCQAASLMPQLESTGDTKTGDLSVEVVVLDPVNGQILAFVGGDKAATAPAYPARHLAGTILSPLIYLTSFSYGMSPATLLWDLPEQGKEARYVGRASPQEQDVIYHGPVSLREAFANDYSGAGAQVEQQVGVENIWTTERLFGLNTGMDRLIAQADLDEIEPQSISILDGINIYGVLANQGTMATNGAINSQGVALQGKLEPTSVLQVEDPSGQEVLDWSTPKKIAVVSPQLAYMVSDVLSDEKSRLEMNVYLAIGRPAAVKTSLTGDGMNGWAMGYTPSLALGVWVGDSDDQGNKLAKDVPAGIWHAIMEYAVQNVPVENFNIPAGINTVKVCQPSGLLPTSLCPVIVPEIFLEGTEPTETDRLFQEFGVDRETGLLATLFTPASLVEPRVYMDIPEDAEAWARQAGVEIAPKQYDGFPASPSTNEEVSISSLEMFDYISGQVVLTGTAAGPDFSYYRIQVGQGLNPHEWLQIGEAVDTPVYSGTLGTWDTNNLDGVYTIQLMVVRQDMRVEQSIIPVTIDNTVPELVITAPDDGERLSIGAVNRIMLSASASDNHSLEKVNFYLDDILVGSVKEFPYALLWDGRIGEHTLRLEAYDRAGNHSSASLTFVVLK